MKRCVWLSQTHSVERFSCCTEVWKKDSFSWMLTFSCRFAQNKRTSSENSIGVTIQRKEQEELAVQDDKNHSNLSTWHVLGAAICSQRNQFWNDNLGSCVPRQSHIVSALLQRLKLSLTLPVSHHRFLQRIFLLSDKQLRKRWIC